MKARPSLLAALLLASNLLSGEAMGQEDSKGVDERINEVLAPLSEFVGGLVFWGPDFGGDVGSVPLVLMVLAGTAVILTLLFGFINLRAFGIAVRTVRKKYTSPDAPGQITHFQALSAAVSATVGLGNIAGVAVAIGIGGPGATFWMIVMGLLSMTTKFAECTLGVKYRRITPEGRVHGGGMYYLKDGLKEIGLAPLGVVLAALFAVFCIGGAFGAGNMFQINQACTQVVNAFDIALFDQSRWAFGLIVAVIVGLVIIGGIVWIGRVASILVPVMCIGYIIAALVVIGTNITAVPDAFRTIFLGAFAPDAVGGGAVGTLIVVMIQGIRRATFSNEAGFGSAPIAHSAVKTKHPASEGLVALLEPFVDTVVVCTMTALVIITTGTWKADGHVVAAAPVALMASHEAGADELMQVEPGTLVRKVRAVAADGGAPGEDEETGEERELVFYEVRLLSEGELTEHVGLVAKGAVDFPGGIWLTSRSFETVISWFPKVLALAVVLFAFSTMLSWSYYGEQAVIYLFGDNRKVIVAYGLIFCGLIVVGAAADFGSIIEISDSLVFAMVFPNLIGVFLLLPVVKRELKSYLAHVREIDGRKAGDSGGEGV